MIVFLVACNLGLARSDRYALYVLDGSFSFGETDL